MNKSTFDNEPQLLEHEGKIERINFDVEEVTETIPSMDGGEDIERKVFKAYVVRVEQPLERSRIIDAIISAEYPNDVMQAVVNNYLANQKDAERKEEFNTMQEWRAKAKQVADEVLAFMASETAE